MFYYDTSCFTSISSQSISATAVIFLANEMQPSKRYSFWHGYPLLYNSLSKSMHLVKSFVLA